MTTAVQIPGYIAGTWVVDQTHSEVGFSIRHFGISKVRGRFADFEATIVTGENPLDSSVTATIQTASIESGNAQRDEHVRSADLLDVANHPTLTYRSTGVREAGADFVLDGELSYHGVTKQVPLKLELNGFGPDPAAPDPEAGRRAGFTATAEIDRHEFGVTFNSPIPGGNALLGDKVQIQIEIQAVLQTG